MRPITNLRVSIEHHISTGHGGWIDLTLIKDVAVVRVTCHYPGIVEASGIQGGGHEAVSRSRQEQEI